MSTLDSVIVGTSGEIRKLKIAIVNLAQIPEINVMLIGATGTGKELVAQQLHKQGPLPKGCFQALNCSGLNEGLIEAQLFGNKKGSFTGAVESIGLIGSIDKNFTQPPSGKTFAGTLFLDELHNMPMSTQGLLLRFLEDGAYRPLGETKERYAKLRVVAAMQPGEENKNKVRLDLYNRLAEKELFLPGLNERREDIPVIAQELVEKIGNETKVEGVRLKIASILGNNTFFESLKNYDWSKGNVRELRSVMKRALLLGEVEPLEANFAQSDSLFDLPDELAQVIDATTFQDLYISRVYNKFKPQNLADQVIADQLLCDVRTLKDALVGKRGKDKIEQFKSKKAQQVRTSIRR